MAKESLVGRWLSPCGCLELFAVLSEAGGEKRGMETLNRKEREEFWGYMQPTRRGDARLEVIMQ